MVKQIISAMLVIGLVGSLTACNLLRMDFSSCPNGVENKLDNQDVLLKKTGDGTMRVIVTLATDPAKMEQENNQHITLVQDRFIKWLSQNDGKIDGRMKHTPQLFMTVNRELLEAIYKRGDVCTIHEDEEQFLQ